jgi:tRNA(Ile2) C34 agmatinyltransferase TiaS
MDLASRNKVLIQQIKRIKMESAQVPAAVQQAEVTELIEHLGVLFNRKPGGRVVRAPYCPKCRRAMKAVSDVLPFTCSHCRTTTTFTASEINDVALQLERS